MPLFYSEAEATTYEVIFGAAFEVESHWPAGEAPPQVPGVPPSPKPIKAQSPPQQSLETCICLRDWKEVRDTREGLKPRGRRVVWGTWYPGYGAGLQVSAWTSSQKATKTAKFDGLESRDQPG